MTLELSRVGDLWVQDPGTCHWRVASAFLAGDDVVLTARHVLPASTSETSQLSGDVFFTKAGGGSMRRKVTGIVWTREGVDLVLLSLAPDATLVKLAPITWMSPPRRVHRTVETCGFPQATMAKTGDAKLRVSKSFRGEVDPNGGLSPASESAEPRLIVDIRHPVVTDAAVLRGLSGAGLVIEDALVGVVSTAFDGITSLEAVAVAPLLQDAQFSRAVGASPRHVLDGDSLELVTRLAKENVRRSRLSSAVAAGAALLSTLAVTAAATTTAHFDARGFAMAATGAGCWALGSQALRARDLRKAEKQVRDAHAVDDSESEGSRAGMILPAGLLSVHGQVVPAALASALKTTRHALQTVVQWFTFTALTVVASAGSFAASVATSNAPQGREREAEERTTDERVQGKVTNADLQREICLRLCAVSGCDPTECDRGGVARVSDEELAKGVLDDSAQNGTLLASLGAGAIEDHPSDQEPDVKRLVGVAEHLRRRDIVSSPPSDASADALSEAVGDGGTFDVQSRLAITGAEGGSASDVSCRKGMHFEVGRGCIADVANTPVGGEPPSSGGASEGTSFVYLYLGSRRMRWQATDRGWLEIADDGVRTFFDIIERGAGVEGEKGVITKRRSDTMQLFVPSDGDRIFWRSPGSSWRYCGRIDRRPQASDGGASEGGTTDGAPADGPTDAASSGG